MAVIEFLPFLPLTGPFLAAPVSVMVVDTAQLSQVPVSFAQYPVLPEAESFGIACGIACSYPAVKANVISYSRCTPGPSQKAQEGYLFAVICRSIWCQKLS